MTEEQIFGAAKLLGTSVIDLKPLLPQLMDVYSVGVKRKIEFVRQSSQLASEGKAPVVGRGICGLKFVGDYLSKFDLPGKQGTTGEGGPLGPPKRSHGEIHVLPAESLNYKWRLRIDAKAAMDLPVNNQIQQGLPSPYLIFGWSLNRLSLENGEKLLTTNEIEQTVMCDKTKNPNWN